MHMKSQKKKQQVEHRDRWKRELRGTCLDRSLSRGKINQTPAVPTAIPPYLVHILDPASLVCGQLAPSRLRLRSGLQPARKNKKQMMHPWARTTTFREEIVNIQGGEGGGLLLFYMCIQYCCSAALPAHKSTSNTDVQSTAVRPR